MKRHLFYGAAVLLTAGILTTAGHAKIGVGIGTGKIQVDEKLKAGQIYNLPSVTIINTGDESSDYHMLITFQQEAPEIKPDKDWFDFTPQNFYLTPGEAKIIDIKLNLPLKTNPGDYFAYLEARPVKKAERGGTSIGVAAATKLYFTIAPANIIESLYYRIISFYKVYAPWPQRIFIALACGSVLLVIKKFFHIKIDLKKPDEKSSVTTLKHE